MQRSAPNAWDPFCLQAIHAIILLMLLSGGMYCVDLTYSPAVTGKRMFFRALTIVFGIGFVIG
jgi:hypothetical protein